MDLTDAINVAAAKGDLQVVRKALAGDADLNAGALHAAASNGHAEIVSLLLEKGADPNRADKELYYPIHLAISGGHLAICEQLLAAGAILECVTNGKSTPLHLAAASEGKLLPWLIEKNVNIEAKDHELKTPLIVAASYGRTENLQALIEAGADINAVDHEQDSVLLNALYRLKNLRITNWYTEGDDGPDRIKYEVKKGCFRCYKNEDTEGTILSIDDQRFCASKWWGPTNHLQYLDAFDCVLYLLKSGADTSLINSRKQDCLMIAANIGDPIILEAIIAVYSKIGLADIYGGTSLHYASGSGRLDGLEAFLRLAKPAKLNIIDEYGWTALHYLCDIGGESKMIELLLAAGSDKNIRSTKKRGENINEGSTPLDIALHWKDEDLAEMLR